MQNTFMLKRYFCYGILGLFLENLWTGLNSFLNGDITCNGHSSLIMFFIYGMVVFLEPVFEIFSQQTVFVRIVTYSLMIFMVEYFSGIALGHFKICPWHYYSQFNIDNVIRLDYIFLWMLAGYVYERLYFYFLKHSIR